MFVLLRCDNELCGRYYKRYLAKRKGARNRKCPCCKEKLVLRRGLTSWEELEFASSVNWHVYVADHIVEVSYM